MASVVLSESPGSEVSEAVPNSERAAHTSFPFSLVRSQRAPAPQVPSLPRERQKSFHERLPMFKSMVGLTSLREEHTKGKTSGPSSGSDVSHTNGSQKSSVTHKSSNLKGSEGATLVWKDLTVTVGDRKEGTRKAVQGLTGYARPGTMLAIIGPPDSGKSTLLQALAGKLPENARVYGEILLNGQRQQLKNGTYGALSCGDKRATSLNLLSGQDMKGILAVFVELDLNHELAFVTKENSLFETLTVRETLFYAALLQLPDRLPCSEKLARVNTLISEMDLEDLAETRIGKCHRTGGLSDGQRRRLSIALQLLTKPLLAIVDEPITLIDSVSAYVVMGMLKKLSSNGCTVVATLEQMSSDIFGLLDKVCLLSSGKMIFFGPASAALEHYANAGMVCPPMCNPADHLLRAINSDYDRVNAPFKFCQDSEHGDIWGDMDTNVVIRTLETMYQASGDAAVVQSMVIHLSEKERTVFRRDGCASPFMRLGVLTWRSFLNMWRDFNYFLLRLIVSTLLTLCIGTLGSKIGHSSSSILARMASISSMVSTVCLMAISGFPSVVNDIKVHFYEREIGYSGVVTFTLGNLLSSALFLFAISVVCSSVGYFLLGLQANFGPFVYFVVDLFLCLLTVEGLMLLVASMLPKLLEGLLAVVIIQVLMVIVAGYYLLSDDMPEPVWKYPASYLSFHGYALEGLLQNEYEDSSVASSSRHSPPMSGQAIIAKAYPFPVTTIGKWNILLVLAGMAVAYRILSCITLVFSQNCRSRYRVR